MSCLKFSERVTACFLCGTPAGNPCCLVLVRQVPPLNWSRASKTLLTVREALLWLPPVSGRTPGARHSKVPSSVVPCIHLRVPPPALKADIVKSCGGLLDKSLVEVISHGAAHADAFLRSLGVELGAISQCGGHGGA